MEPAVKPAALASTSSVIGVLATAAAFKGGLFRATAAKYGEQVRIIETVGEGFVELVEGDKENTPEALEVVREAVEPMLEAGVDHIVLGCTHYPFLIRQIRQIVGEGAVRIVDSAPAIARRVDQLLTEFDLHASAGHIPVYEYHTFADEQYRRRLIEKSTKISGAAV
jgi:glutamate racemase